MYNPSRKYRAGILIQSIPEVYMREGVLPIVSTHGEERRPHFGDFPQGRDQCHLYVFLERRLVLNEERHIGRSQSVLAHDAVKNVTN